MIRELMRKIETRKALVGVVGLGYVGLPLVREFTRGGVRVLGFDIDAAKVAQLMAGRSYIEHIPSSTVQEMIRGRRFRATDDFDRLSEPDAILICVPTPLTKTARAGHDLHREHRRGHRHAPAQGAARRAGIDHLPGHDARGRCCRSWRSPG